METENMNKDLAVQDGADVQNPSKEEHKGWFGRAKDKVVATCERHPKIVKGVKIAVIGLIGLVGGLYCANELAKRSESSEEGSEETAGIDIPWSNEEENPESEEAEVVDDYPEE